MSSSHDMTSTHSDSRCHAFAADPPPGERSARTYLGLGMFNGAHTYLGPGNVQRRADSAQTHE